MLPKSMATERKCSAIMQQITCRSELSAQVHCMCTVFSAKAECTNQANYAMDVGRRGCRPL